jgi:hypothetical protein
VAASARWDLCVPCASVRGSPEAAWDGEVFSHGGAEITEGRNNGNPTPFASWHLDVISSYRPPQRPLREAGAAWSFRRPRAWGG